MGNILAFKGYSAGEPSSQRPPKLEPRRVPACPRNGKVPHELGQDEGALLGCREGKAGMRWGK